MSVGKTVRTFRSDTVLLCARKWGCIFWRL